MKRDDELAECWELIRPGLKKASIPRLDTENLQLMPLVQWVVETGSEQERLVAQTIPGVSRARQALLARYLHPSWKVKRPGCLDDVSDDTSWLRYGALPDFARRVTEMRLPRECLSRASLRVGVEWSGQIFWALGALEKMVILEPLKTHVDEDPTLTDTFRALLWTRFLIQERRLGDAHHYVDALRKWFMRTPKGPQDEKLLAEAGVRQKLDTDRAQLDALCLLLTLAAQNWLLVEAIFSFDGLEELLVEDGGKETAQGLYNLILGIERNLLAFVCPVGLLLGFVADRSSKTRLQRLHPRLAQRVEMGEAWTRLTVTG